MQFKATPTYVHTARYLSLHGCVVGCGQNSHAHSIINTLVSKIRRARVQAMRTDNIHTQCFGTETKTLISSLLPKKAQQAHMTGPHDQPTWPAHMTSPHKPPEVTSEVLLLKEILGGVYKLCAWIESIVQIHQNFSLRDTRGTRWSFRRQAQALATIHQSWALLPTSRLPMRIS